jgi:adenylylsulfate kinase
MNNLRVETFAVGKLDRQLLLKQKSPVIWLTGLSGSGKSTIANELAQRLHDSGKLVYILDGDNIRSGLNKDLGFSDNDRKENIRRIAEVSKLFADAGLIVIASFISPFIEERESAKEIIGSNEFVEVYISTPLEICESRDPKGLYQKVRAGKIPMFTGINSPYEPPISPNLIIETELSEIADCAKQIENYLITQNYL